MLPWSNQLDEETFSLVYGTLKANQFTSRLKIKLISDDQIGLMFPKGVSLGTIALLKYQIQLLRDESPLVMKTKATKSKSAETASKETKEKPAKRVSNQNLFSGSRAFWRQTYQNVFTFDSDRTF